MELFFSRIVSVITALFTMLGLIFCPQKPVEGIFEEPEKKVQTEFDEGVFTMGEYDIVVSVDGDDSNPGTLSLPLKTPEAAKEKLKELKGKNCGTVTVWFREGTYNFDSALEFTADDLDNVVYRSYPYEKVSFSGGRVLSDWSETTINGVKAFVTDVPIENESDYFNSLFKGDKRLSRSIWPKEGSFKIAKVDDSDIVGHLYEVWRCYAAFYANTSEVAEFTNLGDVTIKIMHYWHDDMLPIAGVDAESGRIELAKASSLNLRQNDNFVYDNVREALSLPGEWYLDRSEEKLYYIPEEGDTTENTTLFAGETEKLININGTSDIRFQGISFSRTDWSQAEGSAKYTLTDENHPLLKNIKYSSNNPQAAYDQPAAINVNNASGISFVDCEFVNLSNSALMFGVNVTDSSAESCLFDKIGANAVYIKGARVYPASTNNITVTDCHIREYGRIFNNAIGILLIDAADCDISNNEIHDGWYTAISVGWVWGYGENPTNGIQIKDNLIYNIGNGWLSDMGGIYTLGIQPDTVISGNVIYNVGCYGGDYGYGGWGIYLDEGSSEILVENNLVYDCSSQCFHQHYGRDNIIRNNIFAFGSEGQLRISRKEEHNSLYLYNNIFVGSETLMYFQTTKSDWFVDDSNLYWDYENGGNVYSGDSLKITERKNLVAMTARGYYNNAIFSDPLFKNASNRNFTLATNSPALWAGFVPFSYNAGTNTLFD